MSKYRSQIESLEHVNWQLRFNKNHSKKLIKSSDYPVAVTDYFTELSGLTVYDIKHDYEVFTISSYDDFQDNTHPILEWNEDYWPEVFAQGFGHALGYRKIKKKLNDFYKDETDIDIPFHQLVSINGESVELLYCKDYLSNSYSYWLFSSKEFKKIHLNLEEIIYIFFKKEKINLQTVFKDYIKDNLFDPDDLYD